MTDKVKIESWFRGLQDRICSALEDEDGKATFHEDLWEREGGGGGRTRVMTDGNVIEKGGVNFSAVEGPLPEKIAKALKVENANFFATGVSIVQHPVSPKVPIIHMNVRYFELDNGLYWFGGGIDLTPHYIDKEDAQWFHRRLKEICDKHHLTYYEKFKNWADDYFFIKHRDETRGVGGIFFDRLSGDDEMSKDDIWEFVKDVGDLFAPVYTFLMRENKKLPYTEEEQNWQKIRRGRYVEFNLVWDKGTKFGLDTNGRTESILMSMPPMAEWIYSHQPKEGSPEYETLSLLKKGVDWVNM